MKKAKLSAFYGEEISLQGDDAYPAPTKAKIIKGDKENVKVKRIVFGSLSGLFALTALAGGIIFNHSVNNKGSFYGQTYNEMKAKVQEVGDIGHDLVTSLPYRYVSQKLSSKTSTFIFYDTDNILYFNECTYSVTALNDWIGLGRYHYHFGSNLGVDSNLCEFTFGSMKYGTYLTAKFDYKGGEVTKVNKTEVLVKGNVEVTEELVLRLINYKIEDVEQCFSSLITSTIGREASFYSDFLPAREKGRTVNFALQIVGLLLIFPSIICFFIFFGIFLHSLLKNIKPRLVLTEPESQRETQEKLPKDLNINFGIPDVFVVALSKVLQYGSITLLLFAFVAKVGLPLPKFLADATFLRILQLSLLAGIFLEHFIVIGRLKKASTLFSTIIFNIGLFLFIATMETVLISLTNSWGYDMASLVYKYVPSNVYQVVALHYLIYLFLFFQPSFLKKERKIDRIIWHSLSVIPLGLLVASYFLSNGYALVYGIKENIFVNFWFPNGFLPLSIVCVLFLYATFFVRLHYEKKYGQHNAQYFFYGDRYGLLENLICAGLILIVGLLDLFFRNNQYAYYLGLGSNIWVFTIIPLILLCKYSPNSQQVFLISSETKEDKNEDDK